MTVIRVYYLITDLILKLSGHIPVEYEILLGVL